MTYHLFLDDERVPAHVTWVNIPCVPYEIVRNYEEFVNTITNHGVPVFVTFDHDLADEHYHAMSREVINKEQDVDYGSEKTGFECAKWLVDYCDVNGVLFPDYTVHSMNPIGSKRIHDYIAEAKKHLDI